MKLDAVSRSLLTFLPHRHETHENDGGFSFFYHSTNTGWGACPTDRVAMAHYLLAVSAKQQYLVREAQRVVKQEKSRLLVYCNWPSEVWVTRLVLDVLGFKTERISAGQGAKERVSIMDRFNDPDNKDIEVLVCSAQSAAQSFNFQKACWNTIVLDVVNYNIITQIIGRQYRLGQKREQFIKIVTCDGTYDQYLQCKYAIKIIAQISATSSQYTPTSAEIAALLQEEGVQADMESRAKAVGAELNVIAGQEVSVRRNQKKFRDLYGVRSNRDNELWADAKNPNAKLLVASEAKFYLNHPDTRVSVPAKEFLRQQDKGLDAQRRGLDPENAVATARRELEVTPKSKGTQQTLLMMERTAKKEKADEEKRMKEERKARKQKEKEEKELATLERLSKKYAQAPAKDGDGDETMSGTST